MRQVPTTPPVNKKVAQYTSTYPPKKSIKSKTKNPEQHRKSSLLYPSWSFFIRLYLTKY